MAPILGPPRGPEMGATRYVGVRAGAARRPRNRGQFFHPRARQKAAASWKWVNLLRAECPPGRRLIHLNMDETSLRLSLPPEKGYQARPATMSIGEFRSRRQVAALAQRRAAMSYLAVISDADDVQALLPQLVVLNQRTVGKREMAELREHYRGTRVQLLRRRSAWADGALLAQWVKALGAALAPVGPASWIILSMDACPTHLTEQVIRACAAQKMLPHLVPGLMTHLLQPLDTHVFAAFKGEGRDRQESARLTTSDGSLSRTAAIRCWLDTIVARMSTRGFPDAFASVGLTHEQARLGARCRFGLGLDETWTPPGADLPSLADLHALVGTQRCLPLGWLFHRLRPDKPVPVVSTVRRLPRAHRLLSAPPQTSWLSRLRKRPRPIASDSPEIQPWRMAKAPSASSGARPPAPFRRHATAIAMARPRNRPCPPAPPPTPRTASTSPTR